MRIKNVVKVMNFHSLLRVDSARKKAEKYFQTESELNKMIATILFNKNLILDKKLLSVKRNAQILDIYIGNDYGFCGGFNSDISNDIEKNPSNYKIVIGKKITVKTENVLLRIDKENFLTDFCQIEEVIHNAISEMKYKEINIIYNKYITINSFSFVRKTVFPVNFESDDKKEYNEDFVVETDIKDMLINLITLYICYQIRIAEANSWAAENVMRQQITRESLKKIDEIEEQQ